MKGPVRLLVGALTLLPLVAVFGVACVAAYLLVQSELSTHGQLRDPLTALLEMDREIWFVILAAAFFIAIYDLLLAFGLIVHAFTRAYMSIGAKLAWSFGLVFFGFAAAPLYWLVHLARAVPMPLAQSFTGPVPAAPA